MGFQVRPDNKKKLREDKEVLSDALAIMAQKRAAEQCKVIPEPEFQCDPDKIRYDLKAAQDYLCIQNELLNKLCDSTKLACFNGNGGLLKDLIRKQKLKVQWAKYRVACLIKEKHECNMHCNQVYKNLNRIGDQINLRVDQITSCDPLVMHFVNCVCANDPE